MKNRGGCPKRRGSTGDAYHMTAPEPSGEGVARAMRQALAEGGSNRR